MSGDLQERMDTFYAENGPCCAGCDWWRFLNSRVGECTKSAPMPGADRATTLGMDGWTLPLGAGHALTRRDHCCGDFVDGFDWSSLTPGYLLQIGRAP